MRNVLLLFSKLNPAIRYVQGMNEVLAPLYYVFSTDTDEKNAVRTIFYSLFPCEPFCYMILGHLWQQILLL